MLSSVDGLLQVTFKMFIEARDKPFLRLPACIPYREFPESVVG